ncbi:hypothetical protein [Pseudoduganella sp. OTU4001]|uniref:hypothetical protein n=1 Tax=Pseudoduganella sp. OTU4001 TaxID=3043854 RepID=UPI00313C341A
MWQAQVADQIKCDLNEQLASMLSYGVMRSFNNSERTEMTDTHDRTGGFEYAPEWLIDAGINRGDYSWLKSLEPTEPLADSARERLNLVYVGVMRKILVSPSPLPLLRRLSTQMSQARASLEA